MANVYDNIINGSFNALNPSVAEMYAGIYPPASAAGPGMWGSTPPNFTSPSVGSPNLTPTEQALLKQQIQQSQALQAGYNPNGTPRPTPSVGIPATVSALDQAAIDARNKPGTWMAQSRNQAQALMRQMQARNQPAPWNPGPTPLKPPSWGSLSRELARQLMQGKVPAGPLPSGYPVSPASNHQPGGLLALLTQSQASQPYGGRYTPQELAARTAQGIAIGDANRASPTPSHDVAGNNNAFMPTDHQNSVRWQTGY